jgi:hypothetical protein
MEFYPKADTWLFGGAFDVLDSQSEGYVLRAIPAFEKYIGRLLASFHRYQGMRGRGYRLEKYLDEFLVAEVFSEKYSGEAFPGFGWIDRDFSTLEHVFRTGRSDWKAALENVKGIYLIVDKSNGKKYVGSAYGDTGIWSRWSCYVRTGHGGDAGLIELLTGRGLPYAQENFRLALLEVMPWSTLDQAVLDREKHWKNVLLSRGDYGYNKN